MDPVASPSDRDALTFRALFDETLRLAKAHPIPLLGLPILLGLVTNAGNGGRMMNYNAQSFPRDPLVYLPFFALLGVLAVVVLALVILASAYVALVVTRAALDAIATDRAPDLGATMRATNERFWGALGTILVWLLAVLVGFVLLIVPGFIALAGFFPILPIVLSEGRMGTDALRRAWDLTKGHKWTIFLFGLVVFLAGAIVSAIVGFIPLIGGALGGIATGAANGATLVAAAVFYVRRTRVLGALPA